MLFNAIVGFALATSAIAAPFTVSGLNSTKWTPDHILQPDEVILYGEGRMEVVHESVYHALMAEQGLTGKPEAPELPSTPYASHNGSDLSARANCHTTAVVTDRSETFIDWDVQMSPVVIGAGTGIDVYVSSGYSVSNTLEVTAGLDVTAIKDKLGASLGIDYWRTWSTQTVVNIKGTVANGYSGVMITKPTTTRRYGRILTGCLGSQKQTGTFVADNHVDGSYAGVKWVQGAITMCMKKEYPLSRCEGGGYFV
ncbi:uncharacterized protein N7482_001028 [Penicillium canariense]|uniref:Celp0028 effector like protein n=1 Tax=Penicillium canariense TaxID=189055 RepID=A0A9W9IJ03_9EURO|nr:uncharacterized protein N7482_001028 [Penicillium canariense]KAJ5175151.1 hypothetical protein N7482_001028 [Penicillium canariense]